MKKKISIQGFEGSFHQMAARQFWGNDIAVITCDTFEKVADCIVNNPACSGGLMAIENSIAGSILTNYSLLRTYQLQIIAEIYLKINQHLLVVPGTALDDIKEVHSHRMALLQCHDFLSPKSWKLVETEDTALSARHIAEFGSKHVAAIASSLAAELFNLEILCPDIHTMPYNYTRFFVLAPAASAPVDNGHADKASVYFEINNTTGYLAKVLRAIAAEQINLSKLESVPIPGSIWLYGFYADLEFDHPDKLRRAAKALTHLTTAFKIYGIYKRGSIHKLNF